MGNINSAGCSSPVDIITSRVKDLAMLPTVIHSLLALMGKENHSVQEVVKIVENDIVLTAKVLKVANSAAFARGQTITSLPRAILHLGEKMVVGIAIGSCSPQIFNRPLEGYESVAGELWDHSLRTAIAARELVRFNTHPILADLAFTAGLLHDIGKAIISEFLEGNSEYMVASCDNGEIENFLAVERHLVGTDHAEIGCAVARHWKLPDPLCSSIRDHHRPALTTSHYQGLVYIVHLADLVAMMGGTGTGIDTLAYRIDLGYVEHLKIENDDLERLLLTVQDEFSRTKEAIFTKAEA